jgi:hypothetical protein
MIIDGFAIPAMDRKLIFYWTKVKRKKTERGAAGSVVRSFLFNANYALRLVF